MIIEKHRKKRGWDLNIMNYSDMRQFSIDLSMLVETAKYYRG
ncbi:MAG: hypothetical protein FD179_1783 [Erysipelotrichaceae bacterium]|nr:MAG: hypothetical protein FD179_1783 [Erysipelotrichaceae bacterium]